MSMPTLEALEGRLLLAATFTDSFDSAAEIIGDGGTITGTDTYPAAIYATGISLAEKTDSVVFTNVALTASGVIEFWIKPDNTSAGAQDGFFSIGSFGDPNSIGLFSHLTFSWSDLFDNVVKAEVTDSAGRVTEAKSKKFHMEHDKWQHVAIEWSSGNVNPKANYIAIDVNGKKGKQYRNPFSNGFTFAGQTLTFGKIAENYGWDTAKQFDNLVVHDSLADVPSILAVAKVTRKLANA